MLVAIVSVAGLLVGRGAPAAARPNVCMSAVPAAPVEKIIMKFGGSSVRDAERITEVTALVKAQIDAGYRPHLVCSAMGKTTNNLLAAADRALEDGVADLTAVRELHAATAETLGLSGTAYYAEVCELMDECERTIEGVGMLKELSVRTRDRARACCRILARN